MKTVAHGDSYHSNQMVHGTINLSVEATIIVCSKSGVGKTKPKNNRKNTKTPKPRGKQ